MIDAPNLSKETSLRLYEQMLRIRAFETRASELYKSNIMPGLTHLYIGQEAVAVGVCEALSQDDYITSTHRGHGHCLAKGAQFKEMFAELLGRKAGYCGGKGGSMHIADIDTGNLGANAIVGGSAGIATGAAMSAKLRGTEQIAVCFFGEGALGQGLLYECMNMASLWDLPVIYVCENNLYGEFTPYQKAAANADDFLARANAFAIRSAEVNGQDVRAVYSTMQSLVEKSREAKKPAFLLCHTYRYFGHHVGDIGREYRSKEEEQLWVDERDPILNFAAWLIDAKLATEAELQSIEQNVDGAANDAVEYAKAAAFPDVDEVTEHVYA